MDQNTWIMRNNSSGRRDFLKIAGLGLTVATPIAFSHGMMKFAGGDSPSFTYPFVHLEESYPVQADPRKKAPILVILNQTQSNPFGSYLGEILLAEGFAQFEIAQATDLENVELEPYDILILSEGFLPGKTQDRITSYVENGGSLLAMRPDPSLASLFGVRNAGSTVGNGHLSYKISNEELGIADEGIIQIHDDADLYFLDGAHPIAWISERKEMDNPMVGIATYQYGHGRTAIWSFDLAKNVVYIRQGNPNIGELGLDARSGFRTVELFRGWVDIERIPIPQADVLQRLFGSHLIALSQGKQPLGRIWYLPADANGVLVPTGDSHINPAKSIENALLKIEQYGGSMSIYYTPLLVDDFGRGLRKLRTYATDNVSILTDLLTESFEAPTPGMVRQWRDRGHEFTLHPYVEEGLEKGWFRHWEEFTGREYGPVSSTVRTHRIMWNGWVDTARWQASLGIRLNLDFYHWGDMFYHPQLGWVNGFLTGSALPMRFVDEKGRILNIYQQLTQLADDHLLDLHWGGVARMPARSAVKVAHELIEAIASKFPGALVTNFHVDPIAVGGEVAQEQAYFVDGVLESGKNHGFDVMSAEQWLSFIERRRRVRFSEMHWDKTSRSFSLKVHTPKESSSQFSFALPYLHNGDGLKHVEINGNPALLTEKVLAGISYRLAKMPKTDNFVIANYG